AIDIVPVVQTAIEELTDRYPIAKQYCRLVLHDSNNSPLLAMAGHVRLLQVLSNLLINAWLACKDTDPPTIEVSLQQSIDKVTISVTDNGPGIHNKDADNMFTAFVTTRDAQSGLGLGLTISRSFVENMGGTINLDTAVTSGAKFIVTLRKPKS
ncbi:MAG: GHKL domain-containing protein, partial [Granulosicoccus sp.]|nr:GHKL domain-containing protein [Granulosicoccus sp.]